MNKPGPFWQTAALDLIIPGYAGLKHEKYGWAAFYALTKIGSMYFTYSSVASLNYWTSLHKAAQQRQSGELVTLRYQANNGRYYTESELFNKKNEALLHIAITSLVTTFFFTSSLIHSHSWHQADIDASSGTYMLGFVPTRDSVNLNLAFYY